MAYEWHERDDQNGSWLFFSQEREETHGLAAFAPTRYERARLVSLGWSSEFGPQLIKQLQLISWKAFHWSLPGRDDLVPQKFRIARPVGGSHRVRAGTLPPGASDAVDIVVHALQEGGPLEPPIFRVDFILAENENAATPGTTANWGRRYPDLQHVRDLPYGNVGLSLSRDAMVRLEDELAQLIAGDSIVVWELADLREALRHVVDHFSGGASSGGTGAAGNPGRRDRGMAA